MIVDDQFFQTEGLRMCLEEKSIEADVALSGPEAISRIKARFDKIDNGLELSQYRMIFMDYSMPDMTGLETAMAILDLFRERGFDPSNSEECPSIVCLSAYTDQPFVEAALEVGIKKYLQKPAAFDTIL